MRILVVDDNPKRYDRLFAAFAKLGITRKQIDLVDSANGARDMLASRSYDLLILDILLPLWSEGEEDTQHSADLLFEIREGEIANPPSTLR